MLALCTEASRACCDTVAAGGGIPVLLRLVASAGRDKSLQEPLRSALLCLAHLSRSGQCAGEVFGQPGLLNLLGDLLQHYRDREVTAGRTWALAGRAMCLCGWAGQQLWLCWRCRPVLEVAALWVTVPRSAGHALLLPLPPSPRRRRCS